jgi:hypothetical protein
MNLTQKDKGESRMNFTFDQAKDLITNPTTFGPGIWYTIHINSRNAINDETKNKFKDFIETTISNLPCHTCQQHAISYYQTNPLSDFWNVKENGKEIGLFKWAWNFHNTVNNRLKKPYMSWEVAKMLYAEDTGVCNEVCGSEENNNPPISPANVSHPHHPITHVTHSSVTQSGMPTVTQSITPVSTHGSQSRNIYLPSVPATSVPVTSVPVTIKDEDLLEKYTPKNIIRPNSIEKGKVNRFRNV